MTADRKKIVESIADTSCHSRGIVMMVQQSGSINYIVPLAAREAAVRLAHQPEN